MSHHFIELPDGYKMRMRIMHAVDRPIREMTVETICEKAGVSRQTFYNHFPSRRDLALWYSSFCDEHTLREIGRSMTWREGFEAYFELLRREKSFLEYTLDRMEQRREERLTAAARVESHLREAVEGRGICVDSEMGFYLRAFSGMFVSAVSDWLNSGMSKDPATMARYVETCVPAKLHRALESDA